MWSLATSATAALIMKTKRYSFAPIHDRRPDDRFFTFRQPAGKERAYPSTNASSTEKGRMDQIMLVVLMVLVLSDIRDPNPAANHCVKIGIAALLATAFVLTL
jgi:hypothetical protein